MMKLFLPVTSGIPVTDNRNLIPPREYGPLPIEAVKNGLLVPQGKVYN